MVALCTLDSRPEATLAIQLRVWLSPTALYRSSENNREPSGHENITVHDESRTSNWPVDCFGVRLIRDYYYYPAGE